MDRRADSETGLHRVWTRSPADELPQCRISQSLRGSKGPDSPRLLSLCHGPYTTSDSRSKP